jgi:hypothetical protein
MTHHPTRRIRSDSTSYYRRTRSRLLDRVRRTAPAAGALIATTAALAAGDYMVEISMGFSDVLAAGKALAFEHRNAADAATRGRTWSLPRRNELRSGLQASHRSCQREAARRQSC